MGVDTKIRLPVDAQASDIAKAIGILLGLEKHWSESHGAKWVSVDGATLKNSGVETCLSVNLKGKMVDGEQTRQYLLHMEAGNDGKTYKLLMPRSWALHIALGRELVKLFGGSMDYQDCDSVETDFRRKCPRKFNNPSGDKAWDELQAALDNLKPITDEQIIDCEKFAAYRD